MPPPVRWNAPAWGRSGPPSTPPALWGRDPLTDSFFVRMLYSCLVDGDYLDTEAFLRAAPPPRGGHAPLPVLLERLKGHISGWWPPKTDLNRRRCQILRACLDGGDRPCPVPAVPGGGEFRRAGGGDHSGTVLRVPVRQPPLPMPQAPQLFQ